MVCACCEKFRNMGRQYKRSREAAKGTSAELQVGLWEKEEGELPRWSWSWSPSRSLSDRIASAPCPSAGDGVSSEHYDGPAASKISLTGLARVELSRSPSSSISFSMAAEITPAGMDKHRSYMRHVNTGTLAVSRKRGNCSPSGPHGRQVVLQKTAEALLICGSPSLAFMLPDTLVISCFRNVSC